ncbi:hypothetical protein DTL42_11930 [Bremerella cremea]|uniref:Carboxypeptidase regulatory-like domain-containing protein n=1 Tax=Bremerella cremea TaxID=1031537 RepID=A0A368KT07_9BACT|nr:hypothetical protein [Bremerella cremea]RCS49240.1 hypothetical protein DTL42_11930 [Bremerella cremea]
MTKLYGRWSPFLLVVLVLFVVGCDSDGKVHVKGTATWNGSPIESGYLELQPVGGQGQFESAEIVDGKFSLNTLPGKRRVKVTAEKKIGETAPTERIPEPEPIMFQFIPAEFNSNSTLEMEIDASDPNLNIELKGDELKPNKKASAAEQQRKKLQGGGV